MCGICGKVYLDAARRVEPREIDSMRDSMVTRGPDAAGTYTDRHAGLGHRRLSIIDLEASSQPMSDESGKIWISFNGEIYNFRELRRQLEARGCRFRTAGDTEVILRLYEEYGEQCVTHLRGMFAFAIWDARTDTLLLARDRMGVKPLYYAQTDDAFLFGSELKSLLADSSLRAKRAIDLQAVHSYLSFLCVPDPISIYQGVFKLPAAHTLTLHKGNVRLTRYWDVTFQEGSSRSEGEWCEELLERLSEAVRVRLVADVPLGAFLSGGIDSSSVVALMAGHMTRPVRTFSIGFAEESFNEASDARLVADHLGTDHTELILAPSEAHPVIPRLLEYFDEPFADSSAIPMHFVSELARRHVTVALSGDGGDELFGGYPWRQHRPGYQQLVSRLPRPLRSGIARMCGLLPRRIPGVNFLSRADMPYSRYILDAIAVFDDRDRIGLYGSDVAPALRDIDPYAHHLAQMREPADRPWSSRIMEYDLKAYLPNDILTKVDRMSMLNSLEAREPLLDHHLVEFAATVPASLKIRGGAGKYILKKVVAPYLPAAVIDKRKQGFSIPLETWLHTRLREEVLDTLRSGNRHGIFDRRAVDRIVNAFFHGDSSRNHQVWTLYAFEVWHQRVHEARQPSTADAACP